MLVFFVSTYNHEKLRPVQNKLLHLESWATVVLELGRFFSY